MGWSVAQPAGLTYHRPQLSVKGYTLISPAYGNECFLIDMAGRIVHHWRFDDIQIWNPKLLPSGNLMVMGLEHALIEQRREHANAPQPLPFELRLRWLGANNSVLREVTWDGELVWEHREPAIHHDFYVLPSGNVIFPVSVEIPEEIANNVRGGFREPREPRLIMIGDDLVEVDREGGEVRRIETWRLFDPRRDPICPLEHRHEWTHINSIDVNGDGEIAISCRNNSRVAVIDGATHELTWKYGAPHLAHQHHATWVAGKHLQIFDNGMHRQGGMSTSKIVEVDTTSSEVTWEYEATPREQFFSGHISGAVRLARDNVLICEGTSGRLFEVTRSGEPVWEWWNPVANPGPRGAINSWLFRAYRYAPDYPGLSGHDLDPARMANLNRVHGLG